MGAINHKLFGGMIPRMSPELLPADAARYAYNVDLRRGPLVPLYEPASISDDGYDQCALLKILCGVTGNTTVADWIALADSFLWYTINDGLDSEESVQLAPDFTGATTMADLAQDITDAMVEAGRVYDSCSWDAGTSKFTLIAEGVSFRIDVPSSGADLAQSARLNCVGRTGDVETLARTIYKWRYTTGGRTGGGVTFGAIGQTTWAEWTDLGDLSGFSIRLNDTTYQVRPVFRPKGGLRGVCQDITDALRKATRNYKYSMTINFVDPYYYAIFSTPGASLVEIGPHEDEVALSLEDLSASGWLNVSNTAYTDLPVEDVEKWIHWYTDVSVVRSPVANDYYGRIYIFGDGEPQQKLTRNGQELTRALKIAQPDTPPVVDGTEMTPPGTEPTRPPVDAFTFPSGHIELRVKSGSKTVYIPVRGTWEQGYTKDVFKFDIGAGDDEGQGVAYDVSGISRDRTPDIEPSVTVNRVRLNDTDGAEITEVGWTATLTHAHFSCKATPAADGSRAWTLRPTGYVELNYAVADDGGTSGTPVGEVDEAVYLSYCYSYVTDVGEEGPLSPASEPIGFDGTMPITIKGFEVPASAAARGIEKIRIYRSASGFFMWLQDIAIADINDPDDGWIDVYANDDTVLGELAPDYNQNPPDDLQGAVASPAGWLAAWHGNEICLSEPYMPYAWPLGYRMTLQDDIVALATAGSDIIVLTTSRPVLLSGTDPATVAPQVLEIDQSCASRPGVAMVSNMVLYPSPDGLTAIYSGQAKLMTDKWFRRQDWQDYHPENFIGATHDSLYVANTGTQLLIVDLAESTGRLTLATGTFGALYRDDEDDALYVVQAGYIVQWNASATSVVGQWRGKDWQFATPVSFAAAVVRCASYPVPGEGQTDLRPTLTLYADDQLVHSGRVTSLNAFKLPRMPLAKKWSILVASGVEVQWVRLGTNMEALRG